MYIPCIFMYIPCIFMYIPCIFMYVPCIFMYIPCIFMYVPCIFRFYYLLFVQTNGRSRWPLGLRRGSAAALLLRLWVRIAPWASMFFCCVLSGRDLCDELITRPEESYRLWCVVVFDLETS